MAGEYFAGPVARRHRRNAPMRLPIAPMSVEMIAGTLQLLPMPDTSLHYHRPGHAVASLHPLGWRLLLADLRIPQSRLLRRAGLPLDLLQGERRQIAIADYYCLWLALEQETAAARLPLPLLIAEAMSVEWFDPAAFAALSSVDLDMALSRLQKFKRLCSPVVLDVARTEARTQVTLTWRDRTLIPPPVLVAAEIVFFVQLARLATRGAIVPLRVVLPRSLVRMADYAPYFGVVPLPGVIHGLTFSAEDARAPFMTANDSMWAFFEPGLRQRLHDIDQGASTADRVRAALLELLPAGVFALGAVARKLGLSTRTVQRKLQAEGQHYQQTLDGLRLELALHYLKNASMSGAEIALLLAFDDGNSFVRAFQSWTGTTPHRYRMQAQAPVQSQSKEA